MSQGREDIMRGLQERVIHAIQTEFPWMQMQASEESWHLAAEGVLHKMGLRLVGFCDPSDLQQAATWDAPGRVLLPVTADDDGITDHVAPIFYLHAE